MLRFLADASGLCALVSIFVYFFVELFLPRSKYGDVLLQVVLYSLGVLAVVYVLLFIMRPIPHLKKRLKHK